MIIFRVNKIKTIIKTGMINPKNLITKINMRNKTVKNQIMVTTRDIMSLIANMTPTIKDLKAHLEETEQIITTITTLMNVKEITEIINKIQHIYLKVVIQEEAEVVTKGNDKLIHLFGNY